MKRIVFVLLVLCLMVSACAPKVVEKIVTVKGDTVEVPAKITKLRWLTETDQNVAFWLVQEYRKLTGVDVEILFTQAPDGSTSEIQALFAAGQAPDIYTAYGGRTNQFYNEAIPLDLETDKYVPGLLDVCKNSEGEVVAVPIFYWAQIGGLNMKMVAEYGLESFVPAGDTWTIDQYMAMVEAFAKKAKPNDFAAFFYASSGSGDYWMQLWEKAFGGRPLYDENGKLDVNNEGMLKAWTWYKYMVGRGLAPAGAEGLNDDHFVAAKAEGRILFCGTSYGDPFNSKLMSYPSVDGSFVPLAVAPTCHIAIGGFGHDAAAKAFVEWLSKEPQAKLTLQGGWSPRLDIPTAKLEKTASLTDEQYAMFLAQHDFVAAALQEHGVINIGIGNTYYQAIRKLRAAKLAEAFAGKDVAVALAEFQAEGEALLK